MAGATPYYGLSYFSFRDRLDSGVNIQKEIDRFVTIDKQIYGLYSVFGNGVISGWDVSAAAAVIGQTISVNVSTGIGIIESIASETSFPFTLRDLPPNERVDVFAVLIGGAISSRRIQFVWSRSILGSHAVRIARVTTSSNGVSGIDLSVKDEIGFLEIIKDEIFKHKHRGTPSKIDLRKEVRNQLPGARVEDLDTSKIISGRLDKNRIPTLDHNILDNNGLLSHAALDSFVKTISQGNKELLGEVASVNLLKHIIFLKYLYPSSDEHMVNTLTVIPGVSPNSFIDFDASTAYINLSSKCISGLPVKQGQITSIIWDTTSAFLAAYDRQNVSIGNNEISLTRGGSGVRGVENFESVPDTGISIPGFSVSTEIIEDNITVVSDNSDVFHTEGFYGGKFTSDREYRAIYSKKITKDKDWSLYDEIVIDVKSLSLTHGAVYFYFVNGEGENAEKSPDYLLLAEDEITTNPDSQLNGFERRSFPIEGSIKNNVSQFVIYTDDIKTNHIFWIDNIFLRNQSLFPEEGFIRFRYSGGVSVQFNSVNYNASIPEGTQIRVRVRSANSPSLLSRASFGALLNSGDVISIEGTDAEIDIVFLSNDARNKTPILSSVELQIIVSANEVGFLINNSDDWDKGSYINLERTDDAFGSFSSINIRNNVAVGNLYFSHMNIVNEIDEDSIAQYGVSGNNLLLSPKQSINYAKNQGQRGFSNLFSVYRLIDKNYLVADTDNDRVIEITPEGDFVRGIGSHNVITETLFYPLSAVYNPRTGTITTVFSKSVESDNLDISKIRIWIGGTSLGVDSGDEIKQLSNKRLLYIMLSDSKIEQLRDTKKEVYIQYLIGAFPSPFESTESSRELIGNKGIQIFIGDFVYIDGINHPIFANILENNNWVIGNSSIYFVPSENNDGGEGTFKKVAINETIQFTVEVDPPSPGVVIVWENTIPIEIQPIITFTSVNNQGSITVSPTNSSHVGEWTLTFVAKYQGAQGPIASTQTSVRLIVSSEANEGGNEELFPSPSVIEIDISQEKVTNTYDDIKFSDFTLGSVYEIDENFFLIAGIIKTADFIPSSGEESDDDTFEEIASRSLEEYRGKVVLLDRSSKIISAQYDCPDGSYASDAVLDDNGYYVVAETNFTSNNGRIIKMDGYFNIVWQIGGGLFSKINDVRSQHGGNVVIST